MKAYEYAELFLNTDGRRGETELRDYVANGGDINERDRDGISAMDIATATATELHDNAMHVVAHRLVEIIKTLQEKTAFKTMKREGNVLECVFVGSRLDCIAVSEKTPNSFIDVNSFDNPVNVGDIEHSPP